MVDTYIADKWTDDLETEIRPFIKENFGKTTDFHVFLINDKIGQELALVISLRNPRWKRRKEIKRYDAAPIPNGRISISSKNG